MIELFLKKRVFTNLLTLFMVSLGFYQFLTVRKEAFPKISIDWVNISTIYPGAAPEEVEKLVTTPIEKQLKTVDGIDRVQSFSLESRSTIAVKLLEDLSLSEKNRVINDIQQAVNRAEDIPKETEDPLVQELTFDEPLITLSVAGGTIEDRDIFAEELTDVIEEIPGVSRVDQVGDLPREIWVEVDQNALHKQRLTLEEVANAIRLHNMDASAGLVKIGTKELFVRVIGAAKTAAEIGEMVIRGNDEWSTLKVKDVGQVTERFEEGRTLTKTNGLSSINLQVKKVRTGDTVKLSKAVRKVKTEFDSKAKEKNLSLLISDDVSFFINRRYSIMVNNMIQGGVLILIALFVFLDWRLALVAAIGVPISFGAALSVAVPLGFTINLISLLAFIIVLGMLDDDSVVVAENIYRHMEMGKTPQQAAIDGTKEVVRPVLAAILVSSCGFLPFAMTSGIMGKILFVIPVIIILCFLSSLFEAFFILPSHVVDLMPLGKPVQESSEGRWYMAVLNTYKRVMSWVMTHRVKFFSLVILFIVLTGVVAKMRLKFILFPEGLVEQFFINLEMPTGTHLNESDRVFQKIEQAVMQLPPEEFDVMTGLIGFKMAEDGSFRYGTQYAQARVFLTPVEKRKRKSKAIIEELREKVGLPEGSGKITFEELQAGPPVGKAVDVRVRGRDPDVIATIVEEIKKELTQMTGVSDIRDSRDGGKDEVRLILDDRKAGFANLTATNVGRNILYAVDGGEVSKIRRGTEEIKIKVKLIEAQRSSKKDLLQLDILNPQGRNIKLGAVASTHITPGKPYIEHYKFRPAVQVTAQVDTKLITSQEANNRIVEKFKDLPKRHPGYELIYGGEAEETAKSMRSLGHAFFVVLALDFVILATLFGSYGQPLIILLLTVPIGLVGVVYALILHNQPASFMAMLGVVSMTGVVINNAIVIVNFINEHRKTGLPLEQAVIEAGAQRLRPIWASSLTTLLGLFPTAYGWGGYEPFVAPMALSLAWGLAISMPMTLILIPMSYVIMDDLSKYFGNLFSGPKTALLNLIRRITH
ncbi:MAG: Multidrug resistance protein MdtC [Elusimicrobia bacterium]|nr:Multidrug resistance protein MdtC [Elusimicrobiota bacterium]